MPSLAQDKIEQLRSQLEQCTDSKAAKACKTAIIRLESQLQPTEQIPNFDDPTEALLQQYILEGTVKVYHPYDQGSQS